MQQEAEMQYYRCRRIRRRQNGVGTRKRKWERKLKERGEIRKKERNKNE
jgi:hypothetical protein